MKTKITKIQRFSTHDGDGIRTTVFFRGCPLRCFWCHNPETRNTSPKFYYNERLCICCGMCEKVCANGAHSFDNGHKLKRENCAECLSCTEVCPAGALEKCFFELDTNDILDECLKDAAFYGSSGGITLSGGEPMLQADAATELLASAEKEGMHTAMETCGVFSEKYIPRLSEVCRLFLWDIKDTDEKRLYENTGAHLKPILENLNKVDEAGAVTELRCILISGVNTDDVHYSAIAEIYNSLKNCRGVKLEPYHPYYSSKSIRLGMSDTSDRALIPPPSELCRAAEYLKNKNVKLK